MISRRALVAALAFAPAVRAQAFNPGATTFGQRDGLIAPGAPATPPEAQAALDWQAAVVANGGTVSAGRLTVAQNFIAAEMTAGTWALTDDYWALWAENPAQALTSLKQRRLATLVSTPVFTANRDYSFDGTASAINTGFLPGSHAAAMTGTEQRLAVYERTNTGSGGYALGSFSTSTRQIGIRTRNAALMQPVLNNSTACNFTLPLADSRGWTAASRAAGGTTIRGFKNGVALADNGGHTVGTGIPSPALFIGSTSSGSFRACSVGFACIGASLSDAQEAAQFSNVNAWGMAVGAAVIGVDDVELWVNAVVANGGTVSAGRRTVVETFVAAEKAAGTWALTDDYWAFWAENQIQALTSLKQRLLGVAVAAPAFTPDRDFTFNGTTQYASTGFVPSLHGIAMAGTDQRVAVYERTDINTNTVSIGANSAGTTFFVRARNSSVAFASLNVTTTPQFTLPAADGRGFIAISRAGGGTTMRGFKNGAALTDATGLTLTGSTLPNVGFFIGALDNSGTPSLFRAASTGFACVGASLSTAQEAAQYSNVQAWATAVGANV